VIGTNRGAATDVNGSFKILLTAPPARETVLEARFIGYKTDRQ